MLESEFVIFRGALSKWKLLEATERISYEQILIEREHGADAKQRTEELLNRHLANALRDFAPTVETDEQRGKERKKRIYVITEDDANALWAAVNTLESSLITTGKLHRHADVFEKY